MTVYTCRFCGISFARVTRCPARTVGPCIRTDREPARTGGWLARRNDPEGLPTFSTHQGAFAFDPD